MKDEGGGDGFEYAKQWETVQDTIDQQLGKGNAKFQHIPYTVPEEGNEMLPIFFEYEQSSMRARVLLRDHLVLLDGQLGNFH